MLLLEFWLSLHILFLELSNKIISQFNLVSCIKIFSFSWCCLKRICISLFLKCSDLLIEFLNLFLLSKKLILFLFKNFFFIDNFLINLFIVCLWSLELFFIHVSISFKLLNKAFVFGWAFLFLIDLSFELHKTHVDRLFKFLDFLSLEFESSDFLLNWLRNLF